MLLRLVSVHVVLLWINVIFSITTSSSKSISQKIIRLPPPLLYSNESKMNVTYRSGIRAEEFSSCRQAFSSLVAFKIQKLPRKIFRQGWISRGFMTYSAILLDIIILSFVKKSKKYWLTQGQI
jgi:hypothetical protein